MPRKTKLTEPDENEVLTLDALRDEDDQLSDEEIDAVAPTASLGANQTDKESPTNKGAIQNTMTQMTANTDSQTGDVQDTKNTGPDDVAAKSPWVTLDPRSPEKVTEFLSASGVSLPGIKAGLGAIQDTHFLSSVKVLDITDALEIEGHLGLFSGAVQVQTSQNQKIPAGFTFLPVPQKVFLVAGPIHTALDEPDPKTKFRNGAKDTLHLWMPETKSGVTNVRAPDGSVVSLRDYRPMIRILFQERIDVEDRKAWFQPARVSGAPNFAKVPELAIAVALELGATVKELHMVYTTMTEIELRSEDRKRNGGHSSGRPTQMLTALNATSQATAGWRVAAPASNQPASVGRGFYDGSSY